MSAYLERRSEPDGSCDFMSSVFFHRPREGITPVEMFPNKLKRDEHESIYSRGEQVVARLCFLLTAVVNTLPIVWPKRV